MGLDLILDALHSNAPPATDAATVLMGLNLLLAAAAQ